EHYQPSYPARFKQERLRHSARSISIRRSRISGTPFCGIATSRGAHLRATFDLHRAISSARCRDSCSITLFFAGSAPAPTVQSLLALSRATPDAVARAQREFSHGPPPRSVRWRTDRDPGWRSKVGVRKNMHLRRNLGGSETHSSHRFAGFELQLLPDADDAPTDA